MDAILRKWYTHDKPIMEPGSRIDNKDLEDETKEIAVNSQEEDRAQSPARSSSAEVGRGGRRKPSNPLSNTSLLKRARSLEPPSRQGT